jgi:hypothetical protein
MSGWLHAPAVVAVCKDTITQRACCCDSRSDPTYTVFSGHLSRMPVCVTCDVTNPAIMNSKLKVRAAFHTVEELP